MMSFNATESTTNSSTHIKSVFYCPLTPNFTWDLDDTTYAWILVAIRCIAFPCTIVLNTLVFATMRKKKILQKPSTILLSSMAVTDLLTGAIVMPSSIAVDMLIFRRTSFAHICLLDSLSFNLNDFLSMCSLYHITVIAWERYVAVRKWIDYKVIVTTSRVKKLAIAGWLSLTFVAVLGNVMRLTGVAESIIEGWSYCQVALGVILTILLFYFYIMVYLGLRKRKANEIRQATSLVQAKLESKVAKTTFIITSVVLFSYVPWGSVWFIPFLRTNSGFRTGETCVHLNSLINPIIYCFRDRRFRNAVQELLGIRKPQAIKPLKGSKRSVRRVVPRGSRKIVPGIERAAKGTRLLRSESCDLAMVVDCFHQNNELILKRSLSAPSLCNSCFDGEMLRQQSSSILTTTATIHVQSGAQIKETERNLDFPNDVKAESQETEHFISNLSRSISWDASAAVEFAKRCPELKDRTFRRSEFSPALDFNGLQKQADEMKSQSHLYKFCSVLY
ncbi:hypothetical protein ACROYT_G044155 [Oculina patagonica]